MFAVIVDLTIRAEQVDAFLALMKENAAASLRDEPECHQFDVVRLQTDPHRIMLYELYTDAAAFDAHLATAHFRQFDTATAPMIEAKSVFTGMRVFPHSK